MKAAPDNFEVPCDKCNTKVRVERLKTPTPCPKCGAVIVLDYWQIESSKGPAR